jgi:hypothetical protein
MGNLKGMRDLKKSATSKKLLKPLKNLSSRPDSYNLQPLFNTSGMSGQLMSSQLMSSQLNVPRHYQMYLKPSETTSEAPGLSTHRPLT